MKVKKSSFIIVLIFLFSFIFYGMSIVAQETTGIIKGKVALKSGNAGMQGAMVSVSDLKGTKISTAVTDAMGQFELKNLVIDQTYNVDVTFFGFEPIKKELVATSKKDSKETLFSLVPKLEIRAETFVVKDYRAVQSSRKVLDRKTLNEIGKTSVFNDVASSIKLLPGVATNEGEGAGMYVRGGRDLETIGFLDHSLIHYPYYWNGFMTVFNPLLIDKVTFYSGAFPAKYGNALSGILEVQNRTGNPEKFAAVVDLNFTEVNTLFEGPLFYKGASWIAALRKSYYDLTFANTVSDESDVTFPYMNNINLITNFPITKHSSFKYSYYLFNDGLDFSNDKNERLSEALNGVKKYDSQNIVNIFSLGTSVTNKTFVDISYSTSEVTDKLTQDTTLSGSIVLKGYNYVFSDDSIKLKVNRDWGDNNTLGLGYQSDKLKVHKRYETANKTFKAEADLTYIASYLNNFHRIVPHVFHAEYGLRFEKFPNTKGQVTSPRVLLTYFITKKSNLKMNYGHYYQKGLDVMDFKNMAYPNTRPQKATHYVLGYETQLNKVYKRNIEIFYKRYDDLVAKPELDHPQKETIALADADNNTEGYALGFELNIEKKATDKNPLSGWISYSLSKTERKMDIPGIDNDYYVPKWDQRHTFSTFLSYKLSEKWKVQSKIQFNTGKPYTPSGATEYNTKRKKAGIMIDLWMISSKLPKFLNKFDGSYQVGITNLLNRKSQLFTDFPPEDEELVFIPLAPILGMTINF